MYAVIMASGQGSRLWPLSRAEKPKQFHAIIGKKTLIQETFERLSLKFKPEQIFVTVTRAYREEAQKQLPEVPEENFIVEPFANDTSTTIGFAVKIIDEREKNAKVIFVPSDHIINDSKKFIEATDYAEKILDEYQNNLILIGINPNRPDTSLGYIRMSKQISSDDNFSVFKVKQFVEKPDIATAEKYLASWEYLWNAGMFVFETGHMLDLYGKYLPKTLGSLEKIVAKYGNGSAKQITDDEYKSIERVSFDYGISEKTHDLLVVPADFGWSDVGSWGTLLEVLRANFGSEIVSKGNHISIDDKNVLVMADKKLIATVGLKDTVVIDTPDAMLVCSADASQKVKDLIEKLKNEGKHLYL